MRTIFRAPALALALLTAAAAPSRALDFTLHRTALPDNAGPAPKAFFTDADSKIFIEIPSDWTVTSNPQALDCLPAHSACRVRIEQTGGQPWTFDDASKIVLRKRAAAGIPEGAKNVLPLAEQADLVPLSGWSSLEITHGYEFYGQKMRRGLIFLNLPEKRVLLVTITTPEENFAAVHEQARLMLYGWFEPTKMLSPTALRRYQDGITD